jgi:glycosyltransferase involved in cell wall biosynthesis
MVDLAFVLPPDRDSISGGNLYNRELLAALARLGARPRVLGAAEAQALARAPARRKTLLVVDSVLAGLVPELTALKARGRRVVLLVHLLPALVPGPGGAAALRREGARLAGLDGFIVTGAGVAAELGPVAGARPVVALPPALLHRAPRARPRGSGFRVLTVGNLIRRKNVLELLSELASRLRASDELELEVVGGTSLEPRYAARCRRLVAGQVQLASRVRFRGEVAPELMPATYAASSVYASAATYETFGMAMHEARAFGLPLLALPTGNARSLVTRPGTGRICGSVAEIARALVGWSRDRAAFRAVRAAAWRHRLAETRTWDDVARDLLARAGAWFG